MTGMSVCIAGVLELYYPEEYFTSCFVNTIMARAKTEHRIK